MRIAVCVKQVPDTETKIKVAPDGSQIDTTGIKWIMNPYDEHAVEEAIKIRDANAGSTIMVFTAGPKSRATEVLRTALAMGADEGVIIDTPDTADNDLVARALAEAIKKEGTFDLVLSGKLAIDDNSSAVSQMLAQKLQMPHATVVSKMATTPSNVTTEREVEGGTREVYEIQLPAVVGANKGLNMPRYASLPGIMKAKKKVLKEYDLAGLGLNPSSVKVKLTQYKLPPEKPAVKMLQGDAKTQAADLAGLLRNESKVI